MGNRCHYDEQIYNREMRKTEYMMIERWEMERGGTGDVAVRNKPVRGVCAAPWRHVDV